MRPVLFSILGLDVQTYGVSKALAAIVAALLLARSFGRLGLPRDDAYGLVMWGTIWGFAGAKVYYLLEQWPDVTMHDLGGMGFTWYGGLLAGVASAVVFARRHRLPLDLVAGAAAVPLSVAYSIGRIGCFLAGDGTYGRPTQLPWGVSFPHGVVATDVPVHPTPVYEALAALGIAALLALASRRTSALRVAALYLVLSGTARFLVELLRTNDPVVAGLTQPQLWSLVGLVAAVVLWRAGHGGRHLNAAPVEAASEPALARRGPA